MAGTQGSIGRRRLGIELRRLREENNLTLEHVAKEFGWSSLIAELVDPFPAAAGSYVTP